MKSITQHLDSNIEVRNCTTPNGTDVPNQFTITTSYGRLFRSYSSNIAFIPNDEDIIYFGPDWDCSRTTSKYRNAFLNLSTSEINECIKAGTIIIKDSL